MATEALYKKIANAFKHKSGDALKKEIIKATSNYVKNAGLKQVTKKSAKTIGKSVIPNIIKGGYDLYKKRKTHNGKVN